MINKKDDKIIKPITLEISKKLWEEFKSKTTKDKTLNQAIVDLILIKTKEVKK